MVQLMWKITDQAKELNKVQVTYKIRLEDYQKAMDLILRSSFEMIKNLEEEKNKPPEIVTKVVEKRVEVPRLITQINIKRLPEKS